MQMPNVRDFVSGKNIVPLHSEIKMKASPPALPRREGAGRRQDLVKRQKSKVKSL